MRGRLACWVFLAAALGCAFVSPARAAASPCQSYSDAVGRCWAQVAAHPEWTRPAGNPQLNCEKDPYGSSAVVWGHHNGYTWLLNVTESYSGPVCAPGTSDSACASSAYPASDIFVGGKVLSGYSICGNQQASDAPTLTVKCSRTFTPKGAPTLNPYSGEWETYGTLAASKALCGSDVEVNKWKKSDGTAPDTVPAVTPTPEANAPPTPDPPKMCGGGSCYDPASDTACAVVGGGQVCVSGASGRSAAGACVSSASGSICSGSPSAPLPPAPPASPISDPATQIQASDKLTQADPVTGDNKTVTTNVYAPPGTPTSSGAAEGDNTPPAQDPDKGSASGGQDCNSPPICSGDAPTCAVVNQVWLSRCGAPKDDKSDKNGNGQPDWTEVQPGDDAGYATTDTPASSVFSTETTGAENIDQTSWAGNTCPTLPVVTVFGRPWSMDQNYFCEWLAMIRPIFLLVCGFIAIKITASGGKS